MNCIYKPCPTEMRLARWRTQISKNTPYGVAGCAMCLYTQLTRPFPFSEVGLGCKTSFYLSDCNLGGRNFSWEACPDLPGIHFIQLPLKLKSLDRTLVVESYLMHVVPYITYRYKPPIRFLQHTIVSRFRPHKCQISEITISLRPNSALRRPQSSH